MRWRRREAVDVVLRPVLPEDNARGASMAQEVVPPAPVSQVTVTIARGGQNLTVQVTLGELPGS
jgi:S1-C subfamily serine protease